MGVRIQCDERFNATTDLMVEMLHGVVSGHGYPVARLPVWRDDAVGTMKQIPNILSALRIALCLPLLLLDAMTWTFGILYLIAGFTDMLDGFLARRWGVESKFGARLDSLADFVFVLAVGYKLFPWLKLSVTLWMMIGFIAMVKASNAVSAYMVKHKIAFLHTKANKFAGFLLFIGMMTIGQSYFIPIAWVIACIALIAAIQEGHLIRNNRI